MSAIKSSPGIVWLLLMLLSGLSLLVAEEASPTQLAIAVIFAVAMVKAYLVMVYFMEVNQAAAHWRTLFKLWLLMAGCILTIGNAMGAV